MIINKEKYLFYPVSSLKSQLRSLAGSFIYLPSEFQEGAAIPPKKLFGSSALCIITRVEPENVIVSKIKNTFAITIIVKSFQIESKL